MKGLWRYLVELSFVKRMLWIYFIWYLVILIGYFDADLTLWLTAFGISAIVGTANNLNAYASNGKDRLDAWMVVRFYLAPFCVASFSAMVKGQGFFLIFPPTLHENAIGLAACLIFYVLAALAAQTRLQKGSA